MSTGIVALGWLGQILFEILEKNGFDCLGTYHSKKKNVGNQIQYDFHLQSPPEDLTDCSTIIFNLPPSVINDAKNFKRFVKKFTNRRFIFISSTSVYPETGRINEATKVHPNSKNGKLLVECENLLKEHVENFTIIRPGGLYGPNRHPGKTLSGRKVNLNPNQEVNLVSGEDLSHLIADAIDDVETKIINAVNEHHPSKGEYYKKYCEQHGLDLPIFAETIEKESRIIETIHSKYKINSNLS